MVNTVRSLTLSAICRVPEMVARGAVPRGVTQYGRAVLLLGVVVEVLSQ